MTEEEEKPISNLHRLSVLLWGGGCGEVNTGSRGTGGQHRSEKDIYKCGGLIQCAEVKANLKISSAVARVNWDEEDSDALPTFA